MKSNVMQPVAGPAPQAQLRLRQSPQDVDPKLVTAQPTLLGAIKLCVSLAGFEADKQLYGALEIDAGHWSRITRGEAHFPVDKLPHLMDLCGNEAPLIWLTHERGYDPASLRKRETDVERENRELRERLAAIENERVIERNLYRQLSGRFE